MLNSSSQTEVRESRCKGCDLMQIFHLPSSTLGAREKLLNYTIKTNCLVGLFKNKFFFFILIKIQLTALHTARPELSAKKTNKVKTVACVVFVCVGVKGS